MSIHLTPTELARESGLERREVLAKCIELGIPVFHGCIDKSLFFLADVGRPTTTRGRITSSRTSGSRAPSSPAPTAPTAA